jgi:hypothetical protein
LAPSLLLLLPASDIVVADLQRSIASTARAGVVDGFLLHSYNVKVE